MSGARVHAVAFVLAPAALSATVGCRKAESVTGSAYDARPNGSSDYGAHSEAEALKPQLPCAQH